MSKKESEVSRYVALALLIAGAHLVLFLLGWDVARMWLSAMIFAICGFMLVAYLLGVIKHGHWNTDHWD